MSPVGARTVRFQVTEDAAHKPGLDLGSIAVNVTLGPRVGEVVPDFAFTDFAGKISKLSALRGRYVLLDFWATWCGPCVSNLPAVSKVHERFEHDDRLTVLGLNLDDDPVRARQMVEREKLTWLQATVGSRAEDRDKVLSRYAIGFIPTYILIGPDGKLIQAARTFRSSPSFCQGAAVIHGGRARSLKAEPAIVQGNPGIPHQREPGWINPLRAMRTEIYPTRIVRGWRRQSWPVHASTARLSFRGNCRSIAVPRCCIARPC